jgi:hypothetical protein
MDRISIARSALQLACAGPAESQDAAALLCARVRAVIATLELHQELDHGLHTAPLFSKSLNELSKLIRRNNAWARVPALATLALLLEHCPKDLFLQGTSDLAPELYSIVKQDDEDSTRSACACFTSMIDRLLPCLASPSTKTTTAHVLSKVVAAAMHLVNDKQQSELRTQGFVLIVKIARCMPQVLKSQTIVVSGACIKVITAQTKPALPMATRLSAAHALACMSMCTASSDGWSVHMHGLLCAAHCALEGLPMPRKDRELQQAALDVLTQSAAVPWNAFSTASKDASLPERVHVVTLLLHCVACTLTERTPMAAPMPMSALVLLASRLLSLRPTAPVATGYNLVEACQWSVFCAPLLGAGASTAAALLARNAPAT